MNENNVMRFGHKHRPPFWLGQVRRAALLLLILAMAGATQAAPPQAVVSATPPLRVALIDVSRGAALPEGCLDLLFAELSAGDAIALVEREQIGRILREQALALALSPGAVSPEAVRAGKLLGAEAIVLLAAQPAREGTTPIRLRVVDARSGVRFLDATVFWDNENGPIDAPVKALSAEVEEGLLRINGAEEGVTLVALADFYSREVARRTDWLGTATRAGLEQRLAHQPGVALAERDDVLPLIEERVLAADLPESLRGAAVLVGGEYSLIIEEGRVDVEVTIQLRRLNQPTIESKVRGPASDSARLCLEVADAILSALGRGAAARDFDSHAEAQALLDEAERYLLFGENSSALRPLLAALALAPDDLRGQCLFLHAFRISFPTSQWWFGATDAGRRDEFRREVMPLFAHSIDVAKKLLNREDFHFDPNKSRFDPNKKRFVFDADISAAMEPLFRAPETAERHLRPLDGETLAEFDQMRTSIREVYFDYLRLTAPYKERAQTVLRQGRAWCPWWASSPEQALADRLHLMNLEYELIESGGRNLTGATYSTEFDLEQIPSFAVRRDLHQRYEHFLNELSHSDRPLFRISAERSKARYFLRDRNDAARSLEHFTTFIEAVVTEVLPNHPELDSEVPGWVHGTFINMSNKQPASDQQMSALFARVLRTALGRAYLRNPQMWREYVRQLVERLERSGNPAEADKLLSECMVALKDKSTYHDRDQAIRQLSGWRDELRIRHPALGKTDEQSTNVRVTAVPLLDRESIAERLADAGMETDGLKLRRVVATASEYALIVTSGNRPTPGPHLGPPVRSEQLALVRLDAKSLAVGRVDVLPEPLLRDTKNGNVEMSYPRDGPAVAVSGDNVFVGMPGHGLVWFARDQRPVHFSARHVQESADEKRALPVDEIGQMVILNDKLYARANELFVDGALIELDWRASKSRIVYSPRTAPVDHPLYGLAAVSIGRGRNGELLVGTFNTRVGERRSMVAFNPAENTLRDVGSENGFFLTFSDQGDTVFVRESGRNLGRLDPATYSIEWLLAEKEPTRSERKALWNDDVSPAKFAYQSGHMLMTGGRSGRKPQWFYFHELERNPRVVEGDQLPAPEDVRDLLAVASGDVLVVTDRQLLRVPLATIEKEVRSRVLAGDDSSEASLPAGRPGEVVVKVLSHDGQPFGGGAMTFAHIGIPPQVPADDRPNRPGIPLVIESNSQGFISTTRVPAGQQHLAFHVGRPEVTFVTWHISPAGTARIVQLQKPTLAPASAEGQPLVELRSRVIERDGKPVLRLDFGNRSQEIVHVTDDNLLIDTNWNGGWYVRQMKQVNFLVPSVRVVDGETRTFEPPSPIGRARDITPNRPGSVTPYLLDWSDGLTNGHWFRRNEEFQPWSDPVEPADEGHAYFRVRWGGVSTIVALPVVANRETEPR